VSKSVRIHGEDFTLFIHKDEIATTTERLSKEINKDYASKHPLFIIMLNGAFIFGSDLLRQVTIPCDITMAKTKSYSGMATTGEVKLLLEPEAEMSGREIVIIEDILDTGNTLDFFINYLNAKGPERIEIVSLLSKPAAHQHDINIKYLGKKIPNEFVIGYGLDFDGQGRNLCHIYKKI